MAFAPNFFGGGTTTELAVQPISNRLSRFDIFLHVKEAHLAVVPTNEDLSTADIYFSVTNEYYEEILYLANGLLTTRTPSSITIQVSEDITDQHATLTYAFRNTTDHKVRQKGRIIVDFASFHEG